MLGIRNARLEVFRPANNSTTPDFTVPQADIQRVDASMRAGDRKDEGRITINNDDGQYSGETDIKSGARLRFWVTPENYRDDWGGDAWGDNAWGGELLRWTCMVRDREFEYVSPTTSNLTLVCEDFAFSVASKRTVFNTFRQTPIAGDDDAIINTIVQNNAPELATGPVADIETVTDTTFDGTKLLDALQMLADRADAVFRGEREAFLLTKIDDLAAQYTVNGREIGAFKVRETDAGMVNEVRVDGGVASEVDDEQLTQTDYVTVTDSSALEFRVQTRKSEIEKIEVWTDPTGSTDSVTLRLQKDDGGTPVARDDASSDIQSATVEADELTDDGFTEFLLGRHTLPEPRPWVILEADSSGGQRIGVNDAGRPTYKAYYSYEITVRNSSRASVSTYRRREDRIKTESIQTPEEAHAVAQEQLNHESVPEKTVEFEADSPRTHHLQPLDVVTLDFSRENAVGDYIVVERNDQYSGALLESILTLQETGTL